MMYIIICPLLALCALFETVAFAPTSRPQKRSTSRINNNKCFTSRIFIAPSNLDNHADQMNPNKDEYWHIRDIERDGDDDNDYDFDDNDDKDDDDDYKFSQADLDNHADRMNPNNDNYWQPWLP